jgi:hypothetical protein
VTLQAYLAHSKTYTGCYVWLADDGRVFGSGDTEDEAKAAFVESFNEERGEQRTAEEFEFEVV